MKQLFNHKPVSDYPNLEEKKTLRLSATTVMRSRAPTNDQLASKLPNYVWDYSKQQKIWPDGKPNSLIEATQTTGANKNYKTINKSGAPYALGVNVGGSPDDGGRMYAKPRKAKILK